MASRRPRIVIKPNIKPSGSKAASQPAKTKSNQASSNAPEAPAATSKQLDSTPQIDPTSASPANTPSSNGRNVDQVSKQPPSVDSPASVISLKGDKEADQANDGSNDEFKTSSKNEKGPRRDSVSVLEPPTISCKSSELPAEKKTPIISNEEQPQRSTSKTSHSRVVAPKTTEEASLASELSEVPEVADVPEVYVPVSAEKSQSILTSGDDSVQRSVDETDQLEETAQPVENEKRTDEVPEKPKRNRGREKKERTEPLPPSDKSPDRQKMKMSDLLLWNPSQNFLPKKKKKTAPVKAKDSPEPSESSPTIDEEASNDSTSLPAPQVRIGTDGSIVLDTESLMVGAPKMDGPREIIEEDDDDRYLNTNSYRQTTRSKFWSPEEEEKFFLSLSMCGTDFSLMCKLWPKRSRKELKNKFMREERRNRPLIDKALANRKRYDPTPFEKMVEAEEAKSKLAAKVKAEKRKIKNKSLDKDKKEKTPKVKTEQKVKKSKQKRPHSEDEEDDWGSDYDEEDEENMMEKTTLPVTERQKSAAKKKKAHEPKAVPKSEFANSRSCTDILEENRNQPQVPALGIPQRTSHLHGLAVPPPEMGRSSAFPPYPRSSGVHPTSSPVPNIAVSNSNSSSSGGTLAAASGSGSVNGGGNFAKIQAIPNTTPIQIAIEGSNTPLQGVLLPPNVLAVIGPQLGIPPTDDSMQVLLVQEESEAGNLVHVYMMPTDSLQMSSTSNQQQQQQTTVIVGGQSSSASTSTSGGAMIAGGQSSSASTSTSGGGDQIIRAPSSNHPPITMPSSMCPNSQQATSSSALSHNLNLTMRITAPSAASSHHPALAVPSTQPFSQQPVNLISQQSQSSQIYPSNSSVQTDPLNSTPVAHMNPSNSSVQLSNAHPSTPSVQGMQTNPSSSTDQSSHTHSSNLSVQMLQGNPSNLSEVSEQHVSFNSTATSPQLTELTSLVQTVQSPPIVPSAEAAQSSPSVSELNPSEKTSELNLL